MWPLTENVVLVLFKLEECETTQATSRLCSRLCSLRPVSLSGFNEEKKQKRPTIKTFIALSKKISISQTEKNFKKISVPISNKPNFFFFLILTIIEWTTRSLFISYFNLFKLLDNISNHTIKKID